MDARLHRGAILGMDHPAADKRAHFVRREVLAGEDTNNARRFGGCSSIDCLDGCMRVRRTHENSVGLPGPADIVRVMTSPGYEAEVFAAADGLTKCGDTHGVSSLFCCLRFILCCHAL